MLVDAFYEVAEIMRYKEVDTFSEEIGLIFATVTGNNFLIEKFNKGEISILTKLRPEIEAFIDQRIIAIISSTVNHIEKHFDLVNNDDIGIMKPSGIIDNGTIISKPGRLNLHELQLLEFDTLRLCERVVEYKYLETEVSDLTTNKVCDLLSVLKDLISKFRTLKSRLENRQDSNVRVKVINSNDEDLASTRGLVILGLLIARVTTTTIISRETDGICSLKRSQHDKQKLVINDYAKYSNMGSMSFSGILSCFKNTKVLPLAVVNPNGVLGTFEKTLLMNMLVLSKLV